MASCELTRTNPTRSNPTISHLAVSILMVSIYTTALGLAKPATAQTDEAVRLTTPAFGTHGQVEVRDLPKPEAEEAARAALIEIYELDHLFDLDSDAPRGLAAFNQADGRGPQTLDPRAADLLRRGLQFCIWSGNAYGPLGGELYRLWREREEDRRPPRPSDLRTAIEGAECNRLSFGGQADALTVQMAAGSQAEPLGIARGYAIDRAVGILRERGVTNAWVEIGSVVAALGPGPGGEGWLVGLPPRPGDEDPLDRIWLRDQALAITGIDVLPEQILLDQRTGVPARGVVRVATVTELAVDAEALATALFVIGMREGQMRLGALSPRPAVYWLLGDGEGQPLESSYNWSDLARPR